MNITTGREFSHTNPQDDPKLYPRLPEGFLYDYNGRVYYRPPSGTGNFIPRIISENKKRYTNEDKHR